MISERSAMPQHHSAFMLRTHTCPCQADRDKAHTDADVRHREELAKASIERQELAAKQSAQILELLEQNTRAQEPCDLANRAKAAKIPGVSFLLPPLG